MVRAKILESSEGFTVISPDFKAGKGFVFPYGAESSVFGGSCANNEPQNHFEALNMLKEKGLQRAGIAEILHIFNFLADLPETDVFERVVSIFRFYPILAYDPAILFKGEGDSGDRTLLFRDYSCKRDIYMNARDFRQKISPENVSSIQPLVTLLGRSGMGELESFLLRFGVAWLPNATEGIISEGAVRETVKNNPFCNDIQLEEVETVVHGSYSVEDKDRRGYSFIKFDSTGRNIYHPTFCDFLSLGFNCDIDGEGKDWGYTFGIIEK